jgi:hypothetical protein
MSGLWQQFLAWYASTGAWLNRGDDLAIILAALAVVLVYIVFRRRG